MAVRNFYISADIDGRRTELTGGPASKTGGFTLHITQRHEGTIITTARIYGWASETGELRLTFDPTILDQHHNRGCEGVAWADGQVITQR